MATSCPAEPRVRSLGLFTLSRRSSRQTCPPWLPCHSTSPPCRPGLFSPATLPADNCSSSSTSARPAWCITDSIVCLPLSMSPSIGANSCGHCAKWANNALRSSCSTTATCAFLAAFLVVRFIWRFSFPEFHGGKPDSLGFTRKTATPQPSTTTGTLSPQIGAMALENRLPIVGQWRALVAAGGLMSYGTEVTDATYRSAYLIDRILKGLRPAD